MIGRVWRVARLVILKEHQNSHNQAWLSAFCLKFPIMMLSDFTTGGSQWVRVQSVKEKSWTFWLCALDAFFGPSRVVSVKCAGGSCSIWKQVKHQRKIKEKQWLEAGTCPFWFNLVLKSFVSLWLSGWTCFPDTGAGWCLETPDISPPAFPEEASPKRASWCRVSD